MSPASGSSAPLTVSFPRTRGDEPPLAGLTADEAAFSPHARG